MLKLKRSLGFVQFIKITDLISFLQKFAVVLSMRLYICTISHLSILLSTCAVLGVILRVKKSCCPQQLHERSSKPIQNEAGEQGPSPQYTHQRTYRTLRSGRQLSACISSPQPGTSSSRPSPCNRTLENIQQYYQDQLHIITIFLIWYKY